jgi:hypothetical protein
VSTQRSKLFELGRDLRALVDSARWTEPRPRDRVVSIANFLASRMALVAAPHFVQMVDLEPPHGISYVDAGRWNPMTQVQVGEGTLLEADLATLVRGLAHAYRHAYQTEVMDRRRHDGRVAVWRAAWSRHGGAEYACPPAASMLERDARGFADGVWHGYMSERGRQLSIGDLWAAS